MSMGGITSASILGLILAISSTNGQQIVGADDVSFVIAIFREASRNPSNVDKFVNSPAFGGSYRSDEQWKKGPGRLNKQGKQQAYSFGQFLRRRYAKFFTNANEDILDFEIAKALSASGSCYQATLQLILAGLFPVTDSDFTWNGVNSTGQWQPYLYSVNDRLIGATNTSCQELKRRYDEFKEDATPTAQQWLAEDNRVNTLFTERTGLNTSLANLQELADFIQILQTYNTTLPFWLLEPVFDNTPPPFGEAASAFNISIPPPNATTPFPSAPELWFAKFLRFRQAHAQLCANDSECRRLVAGFFLNHLLETFMLKREDKLPKRKMHLYSARPETLTSIAALFQTRRIDDGRQPNFLSPLSGILIEYRDIPQPSIRILSHETGPGDIGGDTRVVTNLLDTAYCQRQDWCRMDILIKSIALDTYDDWDKACKTDSPAQCPTPTGASIALVRDALTEQESVAPIENGKKLKSTECAFEWDKSGSRPCRNWASHGYCNLYDSVRWLFCRRTCLCNPEFL